jgi:hypothetical protein
MDKRYQVFVSSTYADLREERRAIIQTLIEMDCIPAGMELFPAADEEQFEFIKSVINDCDYYILIIGGRYGSTTPDGMSYTEKEYDYAREIGLKVLSFIHEKPGTIELDKSELDPTLRGRLDAFREKVKTGKLIKFWTDTKELPGLVAVSLQKTIKTHPAVGWVRANQVANAKVLNELNEVRKRNQELEDYVRSMTPVVNDLAGLDDSVELYGTYQVGGTNYNYDWKMAITWGELFAAIGPDILECPNDTIMHSNFNIAIHELYKTRMKNNPPNWCVKEQCFQTVKIQLMALKLINVAMVETVNGGMGLFWSLTEHGQAVLIQLRTLKKTVNAG